MTAIILLIAIGIMLIAFEIILPGGILGVIGGLMMVAGCGYSFYELGPDGGLITTGIAIAATVITLWFEFKILPKTKLGQRAFLKRQITAVSAAYGDEAKSLIGKSAKAITTLSPSGYIKIDGQQYEAFCQSGHTEAGTDLEVIGADNFRLIVSPIQPK